LLDVPSHSRSGTGLLFFSIFFIFKHSIVMKSISFLFFFSFLFLGFTQCNSQTKTKADEQSIEFKVWGNCDMCKKTIETALDLKGITTAVWDQETKQIRVVFKPAKISEDKIHQAIAAAGYDTEKTRGNDAAYKELPECCQYERKP
jgi:periplasmic mercuric ion binding protein